MSNGILRGIMVLTIFIFAGTLFWSNQKVRELDQKVTELQSKTTSLEMEIVKNWGRNSIFFMRDALANISLNSIEPKMIASFETELHNATTIEQVFAICDRIAHTFKNLIADEYFKDERWLFERQIDEYKRIVGMPSVHPNSNL